MSIMAGPGGATVQVDKDNNGAFEETVVLAEGQTIYRDQVNVGGAPAVRPTGSGGSFQWHDWFQLRQPATPHCCRPIAGVRITFCPVSTRTSPTDGTVTFLYNPGRHRITVNYDYRNSASSYTTNTRQRAGRWKCTRCHAAGREPDIPEPTDFTRLAANRRFFTRVSAIDADAASGGNQAWDGGFTLVGRPSLTTQVLVSLGIGRDPYSTTNPDENGNPDLGHQRRKRS